MTRDIGLPGAFNGAQRDVSGSRCFRRVTKCAYGHAIQHVREARFAKVMIYSAIDASRNDKRSRDFAAAYFEAAI